MERAAQRWPDVTLEQLEAGRTLYLERCSGCHSLYAPEAFSTGQWPGVLDKMASKARLTSENRESILRYLAAVAQ